MMNRLHRITHTNAEFAGALDWADLGQRIREATDNAMSLATLLPDATRSDASATAPPVPTDEVIER